ncbi:MAG: heavy metal translocating P-type ATPase [Alloprevotella sp.]|nr:heavy metal translocating P-type ATPase [Alloprevotella sp.]
MNSKQRNRLGRIIISTLLTSVLLLIGVKGWLGFGLYLTVYLIIGHDILRKAGLGMVHGRMFDENFLMSIATIGAFVLAIYDESGDFVEGVAVMLFYQIGEFFQSLAVERSRRSIAALMEIRPDSAHIMQEGQLVEADAEDIAVGETIVVLPGERVPLDGRIVEGETALNLSALTGESLPREVGPDDEVLSGSINLSGIIRLRTSRSFEDSTASRILELVEEAASRKSRSEHFIARFARVYTPAVCYGALALALLPPLVLIACLSAPLAFSTFAPWMYRALVFLVISCPCALVISIPLSFFAGIGGASRKGVLVKGANVLEALAQVRTVVFDKTGTLTQGVFEVLTFHSAKSDDSPEAQARLLELAALAESASSHPIGKSLLQAYGKAVDRQRITSLREWSGKGVVAEIANVGQVTVGGEKMMLEMGLLPLRPEQAGTVVHLAIREQYAGCFVLGDRLKPTATAAIGRLRQTGVRQIVMLTGDTEHTAQQMALHLGLDRVCSELLPADKVARLEDILHAAPSGTKVAFVGDGINDAPALTRADIGIAMGAIGSDAAIEAADVVIMDDDPRKISTAICLSRKCLGIVRANIVFALGIKAACLILGIFGIVNMWLAIFADVGVMVLAVLNALRAMFVRGLDGEGRRA